MLLNEAEARQVLSSAVVGHFGAVLKRVLKAYRPQGLLAVNEAAELVGGSVRSLQRKLAEEGTGFSRVVETARTELAIELLENTDATVTEIALELGYSALPNFSRAFKRWTGTSPSDFRRKRG